IWVGTYGGGLARIEGERWTVYSAGGEGGGLPGNEIWSLAETRAADGTRSLWVGTAGSGLARLQNGNWTTYDTSSGLPNNGVWCLHERTEPSGRHTLWVGTDGGGVARLDLDAREPRWDVISDKSHPALPSNIIYQIREDA